MKILMDILTNAMTWEIIGFACAIALLCNKHIRTWFAGWLNKNNTKINDDIQSAAGLEEEAKSLLAQYKEQSKEQKKQQQELEQTTEQELNELKTTIAQKTKATLKKQDEDTSTHIRLVAVQHQQKIMSGMLDKFVKKTEQTLKKQNKENMDAVLDHLLTSIENNPDLLTRI